MDSIVAIFMQWIEVESFVLLGLFLPGFLFWNTVCKWEWRSVRVVCAPITGRQTTPCALVSWYYAYTLLNDRQAVAMVVQVVSQSIVVTFHWQSMINYSGHDRFLLNESRQTPKLDQFELVTSFELFFVVGWLQRVKLDCEPLVVVSNLDLLLDINPQLLLPNEQTPFFRTLDSPLQLTLITLLQLSCFDYTL